MAEAAKQNPKTTTKREEPQIATGTLPDNFTMPEKPTRGGNASKYPFDDLAVGGVFGVKNKTARSMTNGPVRTANKRYTNEVKDQAGTVVSTNQEREFYAVDVDAATAKALKGTPFEGSTVLVKRSK